MDPLVAPNAKILGNRAFDAVSMGIFAASHDESPTETLAILCEAEFVKPFIEQDIGNGPEDMVAVPERLMTRRGSMTE